jgi:hypothetical protein
MNFQIRPEISLIQMVAPVIVAIIFIALCSLLKEPTRRQFSAILVAGAGAAYLSGGFGIAEFAFCTVMTFVAFKGLSNYQWIGLGWLLHTAWDVAHHLYGNPIIPFAANSSFGCSVCDPVMALWYFAGAPSPWGRSKTNESMAASGS